MCPERQPGSRFFRMLATMLRILQSHVEIHVFRKRGRGAEFLCLRRAPDRAALPGIWQPVTGRRRRGGTAVAAGVRGLRGEIGLVPRRLWARETGTGYFDPAHGGMRLRAVF